MRQQPWSNEEISLLTSRLNLPTNEIMDVYEEKSWTTDRTRDCIRKKIRRLRDAIDVVADEEDDETLDEILNLEEPIIAYSSPVVKKASRIEAEKWLNEVLVASRKLAGTVKPTSRAVRQDNTSLVVVLSDLHFGKHTDSFNLAVAKERMEDIPARLFNTILPKINEVVLVCLGDVVEGEDIYATQNAVVECPVFEQAQVCAESIWQTILLFRNLFKCEVRVETAPGNHGRMSRTASEKSNWDNVVYYLLQTMARMYRDPMIVVNANYSSFNTFEVKGKNIGIYHEGVKHTSTPAMREKIAGWVLSKNLDMFIHGHWHEWHIGNWMGRTVVANGCLCGPDDLSEKMGRDDEARQAWFLVAPGELPWSFSFLEWK